MVQENTLSCKDKNYHFKSLYYDPITDRYMPYKNGCYLHRNCFACPEIDCVSPTSTVVDKPRNGS